MLVIGLVNNAEKDGIVEFLSAFLAGLSCFFAAHLIRLLEKGVHHLENLDNERPADSKREKDDEE